MLVKLFDIQNGKVVPSEHCYTLKSLKAIMDEYPDRLDVSYGKLVPILVKAIQELSEEVKQLKKA